MSTSGLYRQIAADCGVRALENEPLAPYTWLRVGGPASCVFFPESESQAARLFAALSDGPLPVKILGAGSNVLVADAGISAVVIGTSSLVADPSYLGEGRVRALAGQPVPGLARWAARRRLTGLEFSEGIPAQLGGALRMNAGAYGSNFGEVVEEVLVAGPGGAVRRRRIAPGDFEYRDTFLRRERLFALGALLKLRQDDPEAIKARMLDHRRRRRASQPVQERSAGCVFANFPDQPVGKLIDELGLKGTRVGDAEVSTQHGNFIVNHGAAKAADILALIDLVSEKITRGTGRTPRLEVEIWRDQP